MQQYLDILIYNVFFFALTSVFKTQNKSNRANFSNETLNDLESRGHSYYFRGSIGEANCILVDYIYENNDTTAIYYGASDSRRDASAEGY